MSSVKRIVWLGSSRDDLLRFPEVARRDAGFQLSKIQMGLAPDDWKPLGNLGPGIREIRLREAEGIFRVVFTMTFPEAIYVMHCFQKKTQALSKQDRTVITQRYLAAVSLRRKRQ